MGDTLVLGTSVERRESSNLSLVTDMVRTRQCVKIGSAKLGYSLVAMTGDCKSPLFRVRRFESVYPNNRTYSSVGQSRSLIMTRSQVRVLFGPLIEDQLRGRASPLHGEGRDFKILIFYKKQQSYNGYYSTLPRWRRRFDSSLLLHKLGQFNRQNK